MLLLLFVSAPPLGGDLASPSLPLPGERGGDLKKSVPPPSLSLPRLPGESEGGCSCFYLLERRHSAATLHPPPYPSPASGEGTSRSLSLLVLPLFC
jgi:hypothetical protein